MMPMLDANDSAFRQRYPNGVAVRDRLGRPLNGVLVCDPETGEVVHGVMTEGGVVRTHQFWPAPLTIEPCQWLHITMDRIRGAEGDQGGRELTCADIDHLLEQVDSEPLPVLDDHTPEEICGYGDDGLCDHGATPSD